MRIFMKKSYRQIDILLIIAAVILAAGYYGASSAAVKTRDAWYEDKLRAAKLMEKALDAIRIEKESRGLTSDPQIDINNTGIIGAEWSPITTTLGALEAKRTGANPDFAAVVVDMLKEAGLEEGDFVAVNLSGSFPALNIAVISAVEVLGLDSAIISSAGASAWGANEPGFTYPDMEQVLYEAGIFKARSEAVSMGGAGDIGREMDEAVVKELLARYKKQGRTIIYQPDFGLNLQQRLEIYQKKNKSISCFINVGGNLLSSGGNEDFTRLRTGLIKKGEYTGSRKGEGLIQEFLYKGIPVINLLNIKSLAVQYGVPVDPYPMPAVGEGDIFYEYRYPYPAIVVSLGMALSMLVVYSRRVRR